MEIKFRLRLVKEIVGYEKWYVGDGSDSKWLYKKVGDTVWRPDYIYHTRKDQHTGLKDKNIKKPKEIYGGDLLQDGQGIIYKVFQHISGYWAVVNIEGGSHLPIWTFLEWRGGIIIGNVYEDPEFMEGKFMEGTSE